MTTNSLGPDTISLVFGKKSIMAPLRTLRPLGSRLFSTGGKEKIAMIGSGNFGSALVRILGRNATRHDVFDDEVRMYVHEEMIDGVPLTKIINETNENVKYLKGAKFTPNVIADPDISSAVAGATMVCFCLPHQFLKPMVPAIKAAAAPGVKCLSAIKGIDFDDQVRHASAHAPTAVSRGKLVP